MRFHAQRGALFETWIIAELLKGRFNRGLPSNLYFWRDSAGNEIDVLLDQGERLLPIEIKAGTTINPDYFSGLNKWRALAGNTALPAIPDLRGQRGADTYSSQPPALASGGRLGGNLLITP